MTDQPYTEADLRAEAARQHQRSIEHPSYMGVRSHMLDSATGDPEANWGPHNGIDFNIARERITDLRAGAADLSTWAVEMGADGLEPARHVVHINDKAGEHRVRVHLAFAPDMAEETRREVIDLIADAIRTA
jgi:hypothetical protein